MSVAVVTAGLLLFALYDAGTVWGKRGFPWKDLFWAGSIAWLCAFVRALILGLGAITAARALFFVPCAAFALLTAYAVFFAIPFDGTALKGEQKAYTGGVYSLCRHPGVTFLLPALACIAAACPAKEMIVTAAALGVGDILYALIQDVWTFPKTLSGYDEYKNHSRFLLIAPHDAIRLITASKGNSHES